MREHRRFLAGTLAEDGPFAFLPMVSAGGELRGPCAGGDKRDERMD
jgi:hypothetical protein